MVGRIRQIKIPNDTTGSRIRDLLASTSCATAYPHTDPQYVPSFTVSQETLLSATRRERNNLCLARHWALGIGHWALGIERFTFCITGHYSQRGGSVRLSTVHFVIISRKWG